MHLVNRCAITRKELKESDNVVHFPYFDALPSEPEFVCCENIALRSEFEKWYLRDRVTQKVREHWLEWSQTKEGKAIVILARNENFLITKGIYDKGIALFFLNHVFHISLPINLWDKFTKIILTTDTSEIKTFGEDSFQWNVDAIKGNVILETIQVNADCLTSYVHQTPRIRLIFVGQS